MNRICVIGIGYKPLDERALDIISRAEVVLASNRLFEVFKGYKEFDEVKNKIVVINNVNETINFMKAEVSGPTVPDARPVVLLASGDPLFFGIGRRAVEEFGKEMVEIIPDLSSIQMAFSRIEEPWDDAFLLSLHGGPDPEKRRRLKFTLDDIPFLLDRHRKLAILTDNENNPAAIASTLTAKGPTLRLFVCEKLGYPDERLVEGTPAEIALMNFSQPNVVIIRNEEINSQKPEVRFGLKENEILHSRGLITKDEVRAVTIHKLRLPQKGVLWDIGSGSGSISIEAARLCPSLRIFSIDRDDEQIANMRENRIRFGAETIEVIRGEAPEALKGLPSPDRVFIGGSGGKLGDIVRIVDERMAGGIIVINAATMETLNSAVLHLEGSGFCVDVSQVSVARSKNIHGGRHLSALNPVFIVSGERTK